MGLPESLNHLYRWTLIFLVVGIWVCSGRIRDRAVPDNRQQDNTKYLSDLIKSQPSELAFDLDLCPWGQVGHRKGNATVCCLPISCPPGFSVQACNGSGASDKCVPCGNNMIQPNHVWSFNMEGAQCFPKDSEHSNCYYDEENPSPIGMSYACPKRCQCRWADCFSRAGNCYCDNLRVCGPDFTMDMTNGECVPCPFGTYKNFRGCAPCKVNQTLLRLGKPGNMNVSKKLELTTTPQPSVITTQEKVEMNANVQVHQSVQQSVEERVPVWAVVVGAVLAVLMLCLTAHILICRVRYLRDKLSCFCFYRCVSCNRPETRYAVQYVAETPAAQPLNQRHGNHGNQNEGQGGAICGNELGNREMQGGWEDQKQGRGQVQGQGQQRDHRERDDLSPPYCFHGDEIHDRAPVHQPLLGRQASRTSDKSQGQISEALELSRVLRGNTFIFDSTFNGCTFNGSVVHNGRNESDNTNPSSPSSSFPPEKLTVDLSEKKQDEIKQDPNPKPRNIVTQETGATGCGKLVIGAVDRPSVVPDHLGGRSDPQFSQPATSVGHGQAAGQETRSVAGGQASQSHDLRSPNAAIGSGVNVPHTSAQNTMAMANLKTSSAEKPQAVIRPMQHQSFISGQRRQTLNDNDGPFTHSIASYVMPHPEHGSVAQDSLSSQLNALTYERSNFNRSIRSSDATQNVCSQRSCVEGTSLYHSSSNDNPVCANAPDDRHQTEVKQVFQGDRDNTEVKVIEGQGHRRDNPQVSGVIGRPDAEGRLHLQSGEVMERVVEGQSSDPSEQLETPPFVSLGSSDSSFELDTQQVQNALTEGGGVRGDSAIGRANVVGDVSNDSDSFELPLVPMGEMVRGNDGELPVVPMTEAVPIDSDASFELPLNLDLH